MFRFSVLNVDLSTDFLAGLSESKKATSLLAFSDSEEVETVVEMSLDDETVMEMSPAASLISSAASESINNQHKNFHNSQTASFY